ncbi:hypothetical protein ABIA55_003109 [Pseudomonas frederiksbergensis]
MFFHNRLVLTACLLTLSLGLEASPAHSLRLRSTGGSDQGYP